MILIYLSIDTYIPFRTRKPSYSQRRSFSAEWRSIWLLLLLEKRNVGSIAFRLHIFKRYKAKGRTIDAIAQSAF